MPQAEAHACVVDGIGVAAGNGIAAIRDLGQGRACFYKRRQGCVAADGQANRGSLDAVDDAHVRDAGNLASRRIGAYRKELEEPSGVASAALDGVRKQVSCYNQPVVGGTRGTDCRNNRKRPAPQTPVSELESRKDAFESICHADGEGIGVSSAGGGDSALGKFEMAQLYVAMGFGCAP